MKTRSIFLGLLGWLGLPLLYAQRASAEAQAALERLSGEPYFIENRGQWDPEVLYLCKFNGLNAWITRSGLVLDFYRRERGSAVQVAYRERPLSLREEREAELRSTRLVGHVVRLRYVGASALCTAVGAQKLSACHNYFLGNDPSKWARGVPLYREVRVEGLYPGVDVRYYVDGGRLRFDWEVAAGADASRIGFVVEGVESEVVGEGRIAMRSAIGEVGVRDLMSYQGGERVASRFERVGGVYRVRVGSYDAGKPLVIDPLVYGTYLGGGGDDLGYGIAVDGSGAAYVTGETWSTNFPVTSGAYDNSHNGDRDAFIVKLNPAGGGGGALVYSTYLGGSGYDVGWGIAVDGSGVVYVTGETSSSNFPATSGAYDNSPDGGPDAFIVKLNPAGSGAGDLVYSTYLGGSGYDWGYGIAVDGSGVVYVTGWTESTNFPVTGGAYDNSYNGGFGDAFIVKLNPAGGGATDLVYSTYLGGSEGDGGNAIAVDGSGVVYVTGGTSSSNFPVTDGAYDYSLDGNYDAFIVKLNPAGGGGGDLVYSTFFGGPDYDIGWGIAVDAFGNMYFGIETYSSTLPLSACGGARESGMFGDAYVGILNPTSNALLYGSYLGPGGNSVQLMAMALGPGGRAYLTGHTRSSVPTTPGAYDQTANGYFDAFIAILSPGDCPLLPVYVQWFWAECTGSGGVEVGWESAVEAGVEVYRVEVSSDGVSWRSFLEVPASHLQGGRYSYQYAEPSMRLYYRLSAVEGGEVRVVSPMVEVAASSCGAVRGLHAFPNPATGGRLTVVSVVGGEVELIDAAGRVVWGCAVGGGEPVEVQVPLPAGVYLLRSVQTSEAVRVVVE